MWLIGLDGNDDVRTPAQTSVGRRMVARRSHPVVVPPSDRMSSEVGDLPGAPSILEN